MRARNEPAGRRAGNETGVALIMVIGISMVMLLLIATAMSFSVSGLVKAKTDQDWNAAMAAAYAGVEEYESRLANDNAYTQYGDDDASFSAGSTVALPTGSQTNPAFGIGAAGSWADVAGSDGKASFRYEVDNTEYADSGTLRIRSTGRVGAQTRSIVANIRQKGFIDFLYFTDYEIQDPDLKGLSGSALEAFKEKCVKHAWEGRPPPSAGCGDLYFGAGDTLEGAVHSNDTMRICDSTFNGKVTTAFNPRSGIRYLKESSNGNSCGGQQFNAGKPESAPAVSMPATNTQMKQEMRSDLPLKVPRPGCLYTGPTKIVLHESGTMTIRSPWTKKTRVGGDPAISGSTPPECGDIAALRSTAGATIPVLSRNLVYVQNVPAEPSDPNYWPTSGTGSVPPALPSGTCATGNGIGYPMSGEYVDSPTTSYGCRSGDAFVQGTLKGRMTIATENYLYITGDIVYAQPQDDVLGLVGNNAVFVWNPVKRSCRTSCSYYALLDSDKNRRVDAAILSVGHVLQAQNHDRGQARGLLSIRGAIAQKFRGGMAASSSRGYKKDYKYDDQLKYAAPPKFLSPVSATYSVRALVEVKRAFTAEGSSTEPTEVTP